MERLTTGDVAKLLGVTDQTIRRWVDEGQLPGQRLMPKSPRYISREEIEAWAQGRGIELDWSRLKEE